ncbi:MAG: hypothetical protein IPP06_16435 [Saprospiraceae bacterium]|nr:hypothetical protein [Candidatus Vicinibacter affinis]
MERYQEELIRKAKKEKPDKKTDKKKADTSGKPSFSKIPTQKTNIKDSPIKGGPIFGDPIKLDKKLNELTKVKNNFLTEITTIESQLVDFYQQFWALASPQNMVENWDAKFPVLLLPIRIETRFLTYDNDPKKYLGVRFIPDDIFVVTHEKLLTPDEIDSGKKYWEKLKEKLGFFTESERTINHKGAWQVLNSLYGSGRAAYIALKTRPTNWPIDQSMLMEDPLQFPSFAEYKDSSWSLPPRSYIIPDKFVVTLTNGATTLEKTGTHVHAYPLILGADPNFEGDLFKEDDDGVLKMDERIRWLYDFEAAVSNGMAVKIELNDTQYNAGFDKITVLGLRLSADPNHSQKLLEELINNHHYGLTGFGIVPQGTPTNNSKDKPSGYSQQRQDPAFSFRTEQSDKLIGSLDFSNKLAWKDGQWLAHGLGINSETLEHSYYSNHTDRLEAIAMNDVLWHGTLGYYFKHMLVTWNTLSNDTLSISDIANLKEFFTAYISGRGPLPAIRVGNQPYGVLPITAYSKMVWENADSVPKKLQPVLNFFQRKLAKKAWKCKNDKSRVRQLATRFS